MIKKLQLYPLIGIIIILVFIGGAIGARERAIGARERAIIAGEHATEDILVVEDSAFRGHTRRPRVVFQHDVHNEAAAFEYAACHHVYDEDGQLIEGETSADQECSECHAKGSDSQRLDLTAAYHNLCKGCHEEEKKGPVMCNECHRK